MKQKEFLILYAESLDKDQEKLTAEEKNARFYVFRDPELKDIANSLQNKSKQQRLNEINNFFAAKENNRIKDLDKVKEAVSKTFGVDLNTVDFVKLDSGIDALAFFDKDLNRKRIIDYSYAKNLVTEFSNIQNKDKNLQSDDYEKNSVEIAKKEAFENNGKRELDMIDIERLKKEYNDLIKRVDDPIKRQNIKKLVDEADQRNIKYINLDNMVALDEDNNIVESYYDEKNNKSVIESPVSYKNSVDNVDNKDNVENEVYDENPSNNMDNSISETVDITPSDFEQQEEIVSAEELDLDREMKLCDIYTSKEEVIGNIKKYYSNMALLDKDLTDGKLSQEEFEFYEMMSKKYKNALEKKKTRTLTLQNNELGNTGFVNLIFVSILLLFLAFILLINM